MVKILSYNVYWQSMLTDQYLNNVVAFIDQNVYYDFVCLQEATKWQKICSSSLVLSRMNHIHYHSGTEHLVTFYHPKYQLDHDEPIIKGYMVDKNRPFLVLFIEERLCVINIHAGHNGDWKLFDFYLKNAILEMNGTAVNTILDKLQTYDIIVAGDFNDEVGRKSVILTDPFFRRSRKLYGVNQTPTCCDLTLNGLVKTPFDHILSTIPLIETIVFNLKMASDHLPIMANITKNVGYDFDGVLHTDVSKHDSNLQRNPFSFIGPYTSFDLIINQIHHELKLGYHIYIITARPDQRTNYLVINTHLAKTKLVDDIDKITIVCTGSENSGSKVEAIQKYQINSYYDDSCIRMMEIYKSSLPFLTDLYFVQPESHSYTLFDQKILAKCLTKKLTFH